MKHNGCILLESKSIKKVVGNGGNSGRVYVPRSWIGKEVIIIKVSK